MKLPQCPVCLHTPVVDDVHPWDSKKYGPPPWYAHCPRYGQSNGSCICVEGDNREEVLANFTHEVNRIRAEMVKPQKGKTA